MDFENAGPWRPPGRTLCGTTPPASSPLGLQHCGQRLQPGRRPAPGGRQGGGSDHGSVQALRGVQELKDTGRKSDSLRDLSRGILENRLFSYFSPKIFTERQLMEQGLTFRPAAGGAGVQYGTAGSKFTRAPQAALGARHAGQARGCIPLTLAASGPVLSHFCTPSPPSSTVNGLP